MTIIYLSSMIKTSYRPKGRKAGLFLIVVHLFLGFFSQFSYSSSECLGIVLNPMSVKFSIDGPPKRYLADKKVSVAVKSTCSSWVLQCQVTDLELKGSRGDKIPPERLLIAVSSPGQEKPPLEEDFISLDEVVVIARGGYTAPSLQPVAQLWFALESRWEDKPGEYEGRVLFTYMVNP